MLHSTQPAASDKAESGIYPQLSEHRLTTAQYVREMTRQLADIAGGCRLPMVQFLLRMAYVETHDIIRGARPADGRSPPAEED